MNKKIKSYLILVLIPILTGGISAILTMENMNVYSKVKTPLLSPPSVLFPIVWTVLYLLMGISSGIIFNTAKVNFAEIKSALYTYGLSLIFNFLWSIIFFNLNAYFISFVCLIFLLYLIVKTVIKYSKIDKTAAILQIPYVIWVAFAGYLNFGIFLLNN